MAALYSLYVVLAFLLVFLLPGMLLTRLVAREKFADSGFAVSFGLGVTVVPFLAFLLVGLLGLKVRVHLSLPLVAAISFLATIGLGAAVRAQEGSFEFLRGLLPVGRGKRFSWGLAIYLALVTVAYLLSYDSSLFDQERCIIRAGMLPYFDYLTADPPVGFDGCIRCFTDRNAFLLWNGGQRSGPSVFVSVFGALFGFPGFRILHACLGLMAGWFGFHLGARLFGNAGYGYLSSVLLALNPYALSIPLLDENIMALALGAALFYFLFEEPTEWAFAGIFLGLFLGIRHIGLLSVPALFYAAWKSSRVRHYGPGPVADLLGTGRLANVGMLLASTLLFCIPWIIIHSTHAFSGAMDDGFRIDDLYESFASKPLVDHSFLGIPFKVRALLSWPFTDELVRSPYNGFPTLLSIPLTILGTWGAVLLALIPAGALWAWRRKRHALVTGGFWLLVQLALLCTMANWVEPNKMGVFLSFSQPIALAVAAGLCALVQSFTSRDASVGRITGTALTAGSLLLLLGVPWALSAYHARLDERNFRQRAVYIVEDYPSTPPMLRAPETAYAAADRKRLSALAPLPDPSPARHLYVPSLLGLRVSRMLADFSTPSFGKYRDHVKDMMHGLSGFPDPTGMRPLVTFEDMMHHPVSYLRDHLGGAAGWQPLTADYGAHTPVTLSLEQPVSAANLLARADRGEAALRISGDKIVVSVNNRVPWADGKPCHWVVMPVGEGHYWLTVWYGNYFFAHLEGRPELQLVPCSTGLRFSLAFPPGSVIRVNDVTSIEPTRFHIWTVLVDEDGISAHGPRPSSY